MLIQTAPLAFPNQSQLGIANTVGTPSGVVGENVYSQLLPRYSNLVKAGKVFSATATLTAPVIFSTAAGTGGPLIWNRSTSNVDAHILAVGFSSSVVTTVAGGLGLTAGVGQINAPGTTTAIDAIGNMLVGGPSTQMGGVYRIGTPTNAGSIFVPLAQFHTGALTVDNTAVTWIPVDGALVITPGSWGSIAGSATLSTLQVTVSVIWAELPS